MLWSDTIRGKKFAVVHGGYIDVDATTSRMTTASSIRSSVKSMNSKFGIRVKAGDHAVTYLYRSRGVSIAAQLAKQSDRLLEMLDSNSADSLLLVIPADTTVYIGTVVRPGLIETEVVVDSDSVGELIADAPVIYVLNTEAESIELIVWPESSYEYLGAGDVQLSVTNKKYLTHKIATMMATSTLPDLSQAVFVGLVVAAVIAIQQIIVRLPAAEPEPIARQTPLPVIRLQRAKPQLVAMLNAASDAMEQIISTGTTLYRPQRLTVNDDGLVISGSWAGGFPVNAQLLAGLRDTGLVLDDEQWRIETPLTNLMRSGHSELASSEQAAQFLFNWAVEVVMTLSLDDVADGRVSFSLSSETVTADTLHLLSALFGLVDIDAESVTCQLSDGIEHSCEIVGAIKHES